MTGRDFGKLKNKKIHVFALSSVHVINASNWLEHILLNKSVKRMRHKFYIYKWHRDKMFILKDCYYCVMVVCLSRIQSYKKKYKYIQIFHSDIKCFKVLHLINFVKSSTHLFKSKFVDLARGP